MTTAENTEKPEKVFVREGNDRYRKTQNQDGQPDAIYFRMEHVLSFAADPYSLRTAILDDEAVGLERMHAAGSIHELAVAEGRKPPDYNPKEPVASEDRLNIRISAPLKTDHFGGLGFIAEDGLRSFSGALSLSLRIGQSEGSHIRHYRGDDHSEEMTFISVWIPRPQMEWLHRELLARPDAIFSMSVTAAVFKRSAERWHNQPFYIEPESATPIKSVSLYVTDRDDPRSEVQPSLDKQEVSANINPVADAAFRRKLIKLAYWIVGLQALILLVLLLRR